MGPSNQCNYYETVFWTELQLRSHVELHHVEESVKITLQYNCKDCSFQGENSLELKKHIQITKHTPSEYIEECYTCKKEFSSYWNLMNHRKAEHPSNKKCRYFLNNLCRFNSVTCWYKHVDASEPVNKEKVFEFQCDHCDQRFGLRSSLMSHRKTNHSEKVSKCKQFAQGNCNMDGNSCWFDHQTENADEVMNTDDYENESFFCQAEKNNPPDQMASILIMIKKLSFQVEQLEKTQKTQA